MYYTLCLPAIIANKLPRIMPHVSGLRVAVVRDNYYIENILYNSFYWPIDYYAASWASASLCVPLHLRYYVCFRTEYHSIALHPGLCSSKFLSRGHGTHLLHGINDLEFGSSRGVIITGKSDQLGMQVAGSIKEFGSSSGVIIADQQVAGSINSPHVRHSAPQAMSSLVIHREIERQCFYLTE